MAHPGRESHGVRYRRHICRQGHEIGFTIEVKRSSSEVYSIDSDRLRNICSPNIIETKVRRDQMCLLSHFEASGQQHAFRTQHLFLVADQAARFFLHAEHDAIGPTKQFERVISAGMFDHKQLIRGEAILAI